MLSFPPTPNPAPPTYNGTHRHTASESESTEGHAWQARWLLAQEFGVETQARGLSSAADLVSQKLAHRLSRLISPAGSQTLLSRALHLARPEFPFLEGVDAGREGRFVGLEEALRGVETGTAHKALLTVLTGVLDLLVGFIGRELTTRLVGEVWPNVVVCEPTHAGIDNGHEAAL